MKQPKNLVQKAGFTLIELSIVLVIIGLIVGGVLVGQDLIKAAEIRAVISQIEKYNSAVNTFQGKYNAKPGDITATLSGATSPGKAEQFGLFYEQPATLAAMLGHGDNNGLIEGGGTDDGFPRGEVLSFWRHLSDANLVDGSYGLVGNSLITSAGLVTGTVTNVSQSLPTAKLGPAGYITVYAASGLNYYQIVPVATITTGPAFTNGSSGMTPVQAYNIDAKLDDGAPSTGIVIARSIQATTIDGDVTDNGGNPSSNNGALANTCVNGTAAAALDATYNRVADTGGNDPSCSIRLRFN